MAFAATRDVRTPTRQGLLQGGWDFGFGIGGFFEGGFDWGTFGGLFPPIIDILDEARPTPIPVVISEIPQTWEELEQLDPELFEPILETRPGQVPDPYPGTEAATTVDPSAIIGPYQGPDTAAQDDEEPVMAHDWGHLFREGAQAIFGLEPDLAGPGVQTPAQTQVWLGGGAPSSLNVSAGAACDGMAWSGGTPPKGYKVVNYCGQGVLRKIRRRRRRRILSASDAADIATIVGLVGKGQMASALINRRG